MTLVGALVLLVIAGVSGGIGSGLAGYTHKGFLASIALGFVGAWLGGWIAGQAHLPLLYALHFRGESFPVVWLVTGAAIFSGATSILTAPNRYGF
jgi:uncharacterized membrane protein YeaQ/YmgE (transglycosylase-associated protein family)